MTNYLLFIPLDFRCVKNLHINSTRSVGHSDLAGWATTVQHRGAKLSAVRGVALRCIYYEMKTNKATATQPTA